MDSVNKWEMLHLRPIIKIDLKDSIYHISAANITKKTISSKSISKKMN